MAETVVARARQLVIILVAAVNIPHEPVQPVTDEIGLDPTGRS